MTYEDFISRVDAVIAAKTDGLEHSDFADAPWRDLHRETGGQPPESHILSCLETPGTMFAAIMAVNRGEKDTVTSMKDFVEGELVLYKNGREAIS